MIEDDGETFIYNSLKNIISDYKYSNIFGYSIYQLKLNYDLLLDAHPLESESITIFLKTVQINNYFSSKIFNIYNFEYEIKINNITVSFK